jgi:hypothetical protein
MPLVNYVVVSLFTEVLEHEALQIIGNRLNVDPSFSDHSLFQVENVTELLDICLKTMYIRSELLGFWTLFIIWYSKN